MQLAKRGASQRPVSLAVDNGTAHAANPFPAVVVKSDRLPPFFFQPGIENVKHFKK